MTESPFPLKEGQVEVTVGQHRLSSRASPCCSILVSATSHLKEHADAIAGRIASGCLGDGP